MSKCKEIAFGTCASISSLALIGGGIPLLSTSVLGIGACADLEMWTILIACSPILLPLFGLVHGVSFGCNKEAGIIILCLASIAAYGVAACMVAGTYMIPNELLCKTLSGQFLIHAGVAPEAITFNDVYGLDVGIGAAACLLAGIFALAAYTTHEGKLPFSS